VWCQLFSEPDAGSDLPSLRTTASPTEGGWILGGQKVWTSGASCSDFGLALARTDPSKPRHAGISAFIVDMASPGVDVRPHVRSRTPVTSTRCSSTTPSFPTAG
jgi:alkylation response protein AidB-like acyl-CoA dehydrogenase